MKTSNKVWIALGIIGFIMFPAIAFGIKVATSDVVGQGNAVIQKNDATNRIAKQERFEELYAEVKSADARIDTAAMAVKTDPSYTSKTNLSGVMNYCIEVVADYNAEARKYSSADFRAIDLPAQIDTFDPTTDCKEN